MQAFLSLSTTGLKSSLCELLCTQYHTCTFPGMMQKECLRAFERCQTGKSATSYSDSENHHSNQTNHSGKIIEGINDPIIIFRNKMSKNT